MSKTILKRQGIGETIRTDPNEKSKWGIEISPSKEGVILSLFDSKNNKTLFNKNPFKSKQAAIDEVRLLTGIDVDAEKVMAYIVNASYPHDTDYYDAAAFYCSYSETLRTVQNYCVAVFHDGKLQMACDAAIEKNVMALGKTDEIVAYSNWIDELVAHSNWIESRDDDPDRTWTAWLLSEYLKKAGFKTMITTAGNFKKDSLRVLTGGY